MKVLVVGGDGYCGWATALYLSERGYDVAIVDSLIRRHWDLTPGRRHPDADRADPASRGPLAPADRQEDRRSSSATSATTPSCRTSCAKFEPEAIVHFGEQRSAPFSMIDREHAVMTQVTNVTGTLNLLFAIREFNTDDPPGQAGHDGRVRPAEHRHRRRLHHHPAQRPGRPAAVSDAAGLLLSPEQGPRLAQYPLRLQNLGPARDRPEPGRGLRRADRRDSRDTTCWSTGSTTTRCSGRC